MLTLTLPWPPSLNSYWNFNGSRRFIGKKGLAFRAQVFKIAHNPTQTLKGPITLNIDAYPPDKRKRDLDNILKSLNDSLEYARVFENDNQIAKLIVTRREVEAPGRLVVTIEEIL